MTADEIERTTMAHLVLLRAGTTKPRASRLEGEIVSMHETLVRNLSWYFRRRYIYQTSTIEDLYQAGRIGVIAAIRSFDPKKSQVFGPHAYMRIRRSLQQATLEDRLVRMPQGDRNVRDFWAPPFVGGFLFEWQEDSTGHELRDVVEFGDLRKDVLNIERAREVACYDLDKPSKVTVRRLRRRLRQKGLT